MNKTIVYIDGYNLYYSRLRGGVCKWLDIVALFDAILKAQDVTSELIQVKYFTSPIKASFASHGAASDAAQTQYHRALQARHPNRLGIIKGFHIFEPSHLPIYEEGRPADKTKRVRVWGIEEKQTDVNMALEVYRDAVQGRCTQVIICSNDSDLEPAMRLIREDAPEIKVGLVLPLKRNSAKSTRISNKRLTHLADWVRSHILDEELANAQLPVMVATNKKPAHKPLHW
jgi:uncharacterized LabA/DUF88 family protein